MGELAEGSFEFRHLFSFSGKLLLHSIYFLNESLADYLKAIIYHACKFFNFYTVSDPTLFPIFHKARFVIHRFLNNFLKYINRFFGSTIELLMFYQLPYVVFSDLLKFPHFLLELRLPQRKLLDLMRDDSHTLVGFRPFKLCLKLSHHPLKVVINECLPLVGVPVPILCLGSWAVH